MLAKYEREELIGSGTFGNVWLVRSRSSHCFYVQKEVLLTSMNSVERQQALTEVSVLARCRHRNIIRYKEAMIEHERETLSIVMEYAEGGDLYTAIKRQKKNYFNENEVLSWFVQICLALQYIHSHNILHRDLKSQNIFLTRNKLVKVGDFGIARVLDSERDLATTAIGTPYYLSPEICQRKPYNYKSDIWALGCVLYEMVALVHPFQAQSFHQLMIAILKADYKTIPSHSSPLVHDLISILINVDPDKRPSTDEILAIPALQPHVYKYLNSYKSNVLEVETTDANMKKSPRRYSTNDVLKDVRDAIRLKRRASVSVMNRDGMKKSQRSLTEKENVSSKPRSMSSLPSPTEKRECKQSPLVNIRNLENTRSIKHSCLPKKEEETDIPCTPSSGTYIVFNKSSRKKENNQSQSPGVVELKSSGETDVGYQSEDTIKTDISVITKTKNNFKNLFVKSNSSPSSKRHGITGQTEDNSSNKVDEAHVLKDGRTYDVRKNDANLLGNKTITKERLVEIASASSFSDVSDYCPHSTQCQQCLLDVLWMNRIRGGSAAVRVDREEAERLRLKLESVFGVDRFRKMYDALASEWQGCTKPVTLHSMVQSSSLDHVQYFPLLLQLVQIDQLQEDTI